MTPTKREASDDEGYASAPNTSAAQGEKWTPEQDMQLFLNSYERKTPDWKKTVADTGRDKKACQNRLERHLKKHFEAPGLILSSTGGSPRKASPKKPKASRAKKAKDEESDE